MKKEIPSIDYIKGLEMIRRMGGGGGGRGDSERERGGGGNKG